MANETASTKTAKASVQYVKADGTVLNFASPDATVVRTTFANETVRDLDVTEMNDEMHKCAVLQGFAIRTQRSYQALKDIDQVIEAYDATVKDLVKGVWIDTKTGEPKVTQLADAVIKSLTDNGQEVSEKREREIIEKLKDADYRDKAMKNEHVVANLAAIKLEAAKKRAADAKAALKDNKATATEGLSDF